MSRPIVVTLCILLSSESWSPQRRLLNGTYVPVEEPSTASSADMCAASRYRRGADRNASATASWAGLRRRSVDEIQLSDQGGQQARSCLPYAARPATVK